jgi:hypothetical protein
MSDRLLVTFEVDVAADVDNSAFEIVTSVVLGGLGMASLYPEKLTVERLPEAAD